MVKRFDGEAPHIYQNECLEYMQLSQDQFDKIIDSFRTKHLWVKRNGEWSLKSPIGRKYIKQRWNNNLNGENKLFQKPYIIAEIGQAHDGSLGTAHAYIDIAAAHLELAL